MGISINRTRNVVMFLMDKENRGYLKPAAFDSFSDLAQRNLFEMLFYRFNKWLNNQNKRFSNTEYANIPQNIKEQIDVFASYSTTSNFVYDSATDLWGYTGTDLYRTGGLSLIDPDGKKVNLQYVNKGVEWNNLVNSNMNTPTLIFPIYTNVGNGYRVSPTVPTGYSLELFYIRTPKTPKWTYIDIGGNPIYNGSASDLQDFELDEVSFSLLVDKILSYAGISVREADIVQAAQVEEQQTKIEQ